MLALLVAATIAASPCSWNHPGVDRYTGNLVTALNDYALPADVKQRLQARMAKHDYDDTIVITRNGIQGDKGQYENLRDMHYGHNGVCRGEVNRSQWTVGEEQSALVYCEGQTCVVVPAICGNVALLDKKPDDEIDIEPAAGPTGPTFSAAAPPALDTVSGLDTPYVPLDVAAWTPPSFPEDGGPGYFPPYGGGGYYGGGGGEILPPVSPPVTPPVIPPVIPPISPVPEASGLLMALAGLMLLLYLNKNRR